MRYTKEKKLEILNYAYEHGVMNAARKYHVDEGNIKKWNDKYHIYDPRVRHEYSETEKRQILGEVLTYGVTQTAYRHNLSPVVLARWNKILDVYPRGRAVVHDNPDKHSEEEKLEILKYTKEHGISSAARRYNVSQSLIQVWNTAYKFYKTRKYTRRTDAQKAEILTYATQHSILEAARKYNVADGTIRQWIAKQKEY